MLKPPRNANYAATVVELKSFAQLAGCDRIQAAFIFGCQVIVGKDVKAGDVGLFFPVETALSHEFLANNNLYRNPEHGNVDKTVKGFFEQHGRVKCVRFRGHKSEGFWIPLYSPAYCLRYLHSENFDGIEIGTTFDFIGDSEICRKYVPRRNPGKVLSAPMKKQAVLMDAIVPEQFRFHPDTEQLRRNLHKIRHGAYISVSDKWHGTSVVISKVLVKRKLTWYEVLAQKLGVKVQTSQYGLVYSSRRVIKNAGGIDNTRRNDFYTEDIWGIVAREVEHKIPDGYTLYGEIVGFTPDGSPIQKGYHYGCNVGNHRFVVYRVTVTNTAGQVLELSWPQMKEFCNFRELETVPELYYGPAEDIITFSEDADEWDSDILSVLESRWVHDQMCEYNNHEVPAEGIVVRIDHLDHCEAFKLKSFEFLSRETKSLDKGEIDTETEQSETEGA